jgi:hypothetical protein
MRPNEFVYSINEWRSKTFKNLGVIMDGIMSFLPHIEAIISKSSRMLGFINRISRDFRDPFHSLCGASTAVESVAVASL